MFEVNWPDAATLDRSIVVVTDMEKDLWLFSTSGGTDLCARHSWVDVPFCPSAPASCSAALYGKVKAYDEEGWPVIDEVGELVITEPMPSMPLYL